MMLACRRSAEPPIVAKTGPIEFLEDDGEPMGMPIDAYVTTFADFKRKHPDPRIVPAEQFPPGLSPAARADTAISVGRTTVTWLVDGDAQHGYFMIYDANANGDLRDDPRLPFTAHHGSFDLVVPTKITRPDGSELPFAHRFRVRGDHVYDQLVTLRRGTITAGGRARPFMLLPNVGTFAHPGAVLVIDVDGDGVAKLASESPEMFFAFEHTINLADHSYDFTIDPHGDALTLTPRAFIPARASLAVGTPAPELAGTDLDGQPVALSGLRGRTVLVDFWAPNCPPCRAALPKLADLYRRRHAGGLDIVSVIAGERDAAEKLLGPKPYPGHQILDAGHDFPAYRTVVWPTYFIVDPSGNIACARCEIDDVLAKLDR
jgi:thiol-disulfide isomerase/thioredoxin